MPLDMKVGLGPGHIVLDGNPASTPKNGAQPLQFSAGVYCGQTAGLIKMPLDTKVGFGPGDIVSGADPAPASLPKKGHRPPIFGPRLL